MADISPNRNSSFRRNIVGFLASPATTVPLGLITFLIAYLDKGTKPFLFSLGTYLVFFPLSELAKLRENKDNEKAQAELIQKAVKKQPSKDVLSRFKASIEKMRDYKSAVQQLPKEQAEKQREAALLHSLESIVLLAKAFNNPKLTTRYAANVMFFRSVKDIHEMKKEQEICARLKFSENQNLVGLLGVLDLQTNLSAVCNGIDHTCSRDSQLAEMAIPIPHDAYTQSKKLLRVIPGAAAALEKKDKQFIVFDTAQLSHLQDGYSLSPEVLRLIGDYFGDRSGPGALVKSFVSLSVPTGRQDGRLAVINIHSDRTHIFPEDEDFADFNSLISPILFDIGDFLD